MTTIDAIADEAAALFRSAFADRSPDAAATVRCAAPGRVNVIGEHTDYNAGFVLPMAIDRYTVVAAAPRTDGLLRFTSLVGAASADTASVDTAEPVRIAVDGLAPGLPGGWANYPAGVAWSLIEAGALPASFSGADLAVASTVPVGAGLSSSAALECATGLALAALGGTDLGAADLARLAQRAENAYAGVPCGPLDQLSSAFGESGAVLYIDTRSFDIEVHPFDLAAAGLTLLVINTRVSHDLGESAYADRRATCEKSATVLGFPTLRDLSAADLPRVAAVLDPVAARRVRHVVTENDRVQRFVSLLNLGPLEGSRLAAAGELLTASHVSLRDDYEVSCAELDLVVEAALRGGAHGARMTGGGFGGSAIALVRLERVEQVIDAVLAALPTAEVFPATAARGAHRIAG
jgi:galactokinase